MCRTAESSGWLSQAVAEADRRNVRSDAGGSKEHPVTFPLGDGGRGQRVDEPILRRMPEVCVDLSHSILWRVRFVTPENVRWRRLAGGKQESDDPGRRRQRGYTHSDRVPTKETRLQRGDRIQR